MGDTYAKERLYRNPDGSIVTESEVVFGSGLAYAEGDLIEDEEDAKKAKGLTTSKPARDAQPDTAGIRTQTPAPKATASTDDGNTVPVTNKVETSNVVEGADAGAAAKTTPKEARAARAATKS